MKQYRELIKSDFNRKAGMISNLNQKTETTSESFKFIGNPIEIALGNKIYFSIPFEGELNFIQLHDMENQKILKKLELNKTYIIYAFWKQYYFENIDTGGHFLFIEKFDELPDFNIGDMEGFNIDVKKSEFLFKSDVNKLFQETIKPDLYYVYGLVDPLKNEIFYIGKGKENRIFSHEFEKKERNIIKKYIILSRIAWGIGLQYYFLGYNLSEDEAYILEESSIKEYGREYYDEGGTLTNILEGGMDKRQKYLQWRKQRAANFETEKTDCRFEISGFHYLKPEIKNIVLNQLKEGDELLLKPNPENKHDKTAIKVMLGNYQIGWVSKYYDNKQNLFEELIDGINVQVFCSKKAIKPKTPNTLPIVEGNLLFTNYDVKLVEGKYNVKD